MAATSRLDPVWTMEGNASMFRFWITVDELGLPEVVTQQWPTSRDTLAVHDAKVTLHQGCEHDATVLLDDETVMRIYLEGGHVRATVAAASEEKALAAIATLREQYPPTDFADGTVPITFWSYSPHGPRAVSRKIDVSPWERIADNYSTVARGRLDEMMEGFRPSHGGQLVLWQGEPGTGKTHALRALAWEWRDWADLHYIVDPDNLFGDHADYLLDVLLHDHLSVDEQAKRWRVLILEDTGEILAADARQQVGQALARLLNTVDGMIGQGLRVLVLVTTNEELKKLHPAVARPGRCAMQITFDKLDETASHHWAIRHGIDPEDAPTDPHSLADLYALVDGYSTRERGRQVGFAAV